jgi:hypothetical protein
MVVPDFSKIDSFGQTILKQRSVMSPRLIFQLRRTSVQHDTSMTMDYFFQKNQNGGQVQNGGQGNLNYLISRERVKFLLSSYEIWESIGFTSGKSKFFFALFHFLGLIIPKKHV